ncbi:uncharacterized protein TNCV_1421191 [Trichonephila clavipes]|nr:uncharacterized protein TNCV_1421191 [Trichonephila clavipes]
MTFLPSANNFMVTHPGQTIIDKNISERLSTAYFRAATVGNADKGFKKCGIETHNPLVFSEHDFTASKATDHDVGDETENNRANPQTMVVENQHINPPEEPEQMTNVDYEALKKPDGILFYFKPLPKVTHEKKRKRKKVSSSILTSRRKNRKL